MIDNETRRYEIRESVSQLDRLSRMSIVAEKRKWTITTMDVELYGASWNGGTVPSPITGG